MHPLGEYSASRVGRKAWTKGLSRIEYYGAVDLSAVKLLDRPSRVFENSQRTLVNDSDAAEEFVEKA
jgi:hypothetical protein